MIQIDRSYDLRGIYPTEVNSELFYSLGRAFADHITGSTIAVGYDARLSSPELAEAFTQGIIRQGKNVVSLGLVSTDMVNFCTYQYSDIDAGAMITASHNPGQYNGLKTCYKYAEPINLKQVGKAWQETIENNTFRTSTTSGTIVYRDILEDWIDFLTSHISVPLTRQYRVVVDAGNGVAGIFMRKLAHRLGLDLVELFFEPDGHFPNHRPSPIEPENVIALQHAVISEKADIGIAFDGDADRVVLCDKHGVMISGSVMTAIIAESILRSCPGKKVIYNAVCHDIVKNTVVAMGGIGVREKVGHVYIKERLKADPEIIFGGEHSAHYYFRDSHGSDSGALALMYIFDILEKNAESLDILRKKYELSAVIDETNFEVANIAEATQVILQAFPEGKIEYFDGVTLTLPEGWINIRPSSNEPFLRVNMEMRTHEELEKHLQSIREILQSIKK